MFLAHMKVRLLEVARNAQIATKNHTDISKKTFAHQLALIDIQIISEYIAAYLSNRNYLRSRVRIPDIKGSLPNLNPEEIAKAEIFLNTNTEIHSAFFHISKILEEYFNDLYLACLNKDEEAQSQAKGFEGETAKQTLQSELLPQMIAGLEEDFMNPNPNVFSKGLKQAFENDAFGKKRECPFSRKISTIFALQPTRKHEDVVVISEEREPGALPMFIYREILEARYCSMRLKSQASTSHVSPIAY